jgi:hypothetical protein
MSRGWRTWNYKVRSWFRSRAPYCIFRSQRLYCVNRQIDRYDARNLPWYCISISSVLVYHSAIKFLNLLTLKQEVLSDASLKKVWLQWEVFNGASLKNARLQRCESGLHMSMSNSSRSGSDGILKCSTSNRKSDGIFRAFRSIRSWDLR